MKRYILIIAIMLVTQCKTQAQGVTFSFNTGYGFYNMSSLKEFTHTDFDQLPFTAKIISNYPPYLFYQPRVFYTKGRFNLGLVYTFQSTGSRISSKDYSGEYLFDTRIEGNSGGVLVGYNIAKYKSVQIGAHSGIGLTFSHLRVDESLRLDSITASKNYKFSNYSVYLEPGVDLKYPVGSFELGLDIGYCWELKRTDLELVSNPRDKFEVKKAPSKSDMWNGFRIGITASFSLMKKATSESQ
jgi:hypothetical protein